jgi:hypothetical protein
MPLLTILGDWMWGQRVATECDSVRATLVIAVPNASGAKADVVDLRGDRGGMEIGQGHTETTRSDVSSEHDWRTARLELGQDPISFLLLPEMMSAL